MTPHAKLLRQIDELKAQAKRLAAGERRAAIRTCNSLIAAHDISISEIRFFASRQPPGSSRGRRSAAAC